MPTLIARVEPATKARFRAMATARGLTESELLRAVVLAVTGEDQPPAPATPATAEASEAGRLTVRLPRFLLDATKSRAQSQGMAPSRWVAALVQSNLASKPVLTAGELMELRASNRELAALGRNLNQIARALNESFHQTDRIKLETLDGLAQAIEHQRQTIRALVRASQQAWGVGDGAD
ncbi:MAG: hypothetical protein RIR70_1522 [Pseudomonadota bacterium]|jgi:hypothetical protein